MINATLARAIIPLFLRWRISANQITMLSLAIGLLGAVGFASGTAAGMIWGAMAFLAANLLDECDGSVARATGTSSGWGSWLDTLVGCAVHAVFFVGLGIGLSRALSERIWMLLGFLAGLGVIVSTAAYVVSQAMARGREAWLHPDPPRPAKKGFLEFLKGTLRTDFSVVVLIAAVLGSMKWILWGGFVGAFAFWIPSDLWMALRLKRSAP